MIMKLCPACKVEKPSTEYGFSRTRRDGLSPYCKPCGKEKANALAKRPDQAQKRKDWYEANRDKVQKQAKTRWQEKKEAYNPARQRWAEENRDKMLRHQKNLRISFLAFIEEMKKGKPCLDCGKAYPSYIMEYDHVRGEKRFNIGGMAHHKRDRVLDEIAKCELVCCACHRTRSHKRRQEAQTERLVAFRTWVNLLKENPCKDCGAVLPAEAMDFDHVRGEKKKGISNMWTWPRSKVLAELGKCDLVCANCHRERTIQRLWSIEGRKAA